MGLRDYAMILLMATYGLCAFGRVLRSRGGVVQKQ
jgi:hypothetical protein